MAAVSHTPWELKTETSGEETRVFFSGHDIALDEASTESLQDRLFQVAQDFGRHHVRLDLDNVTFLTSSILGLFLHLDRLLHFEGGRLTLTNVQPNIFEVFTLTNLNRVLDIQPRPAPSA